MPADLQTFLLKLEQAGELKRIKTLVSKDLEITEIARRSILEDNKALLFENVEGSSFPLVINTYSSMKRIEMGLSKHPEEVAQNLINLVDSVLPPTPKNIWRARSQVFSLRNFIKRRSLRPLVKQNQTKNFNLHGLPALKCWPEDGGNFITLPLVVTVGKNNAPNMGMYRMQIYDQKSTGMHFQIQKTGQFNLHYSKESGKKLDVGVALGGDVALTIAAITALPEGIDEMAYAGLIRGSATKVYKSEFGKLILPSEAEFTLEGYIDQNELRDEGPFGDHFGHYSEKAPFPIFRVQKLNYRNLPVYPATVVGKPPMEDRWLGDASQMIAGPLIKLVHKEVHDMWAYYEAGFHNLLVVAIDERYEKEAVKTALGILGEGQLSLTKTLVLVSKEVNPRNFREVLKALRENFVPENDFYLVPNTAADTLDFTSGKQKISSKIILNATKKRPQNRKPLEKGGLDLLSRMGISDSDWRVLEDVMLVIRLKKEQDAKTISKEVAKSGQLGWLKLACLVSSDVNIDDDVDLIWGIFTRFDCTNDIVFTKQSFYKASPQYSGVLVVDATWKKGYQKPLIMNDEIVKLVDRRWKEYFK